MPVSTYRAPYRSHPALRGESPWPQLPDAERDDHDQRAGNEQRREEQIERIRDRGNQRVGREVRNCCAERSELDVVVGFDTEVIRHARARGEQRLHGRGFIGANDASLGLVDWFTRFITIGGRLMSGDPNGKDFRPHIDSPEGIAALQMLIDALPYAPKNVTQYGFAENVDGFSVGKIAQMVFWATIAGPVFDKEKSLVADKTGTAPVPAGPGQKPRSILGGWGIGIPKNADETKKAAAWRALTWLTSKKTNRYEIEKYQVSPSRMSTFMEPDLVKRFPFLPDSANAIANAEIMPTAYIPEVFQLNAVLCVELNKALIGAQDAKAACAISRSDDEGKTTVRFGSDFNCSNT